MIIEDLLKELMDKKGSDLHISNGLPPVIRLDGKLVRLDYEPLTSEGVEALLFPMMSNEQRRKLEQEWELDFSYGVEGIGRFRVNFYKDKGSYAAAFRTIATTAPQLEELGMPPIVTTIADKPRGLVLVTGPTGSGKSTTLYMILEELAKRSVNISTIEDPVEKNVPKLNQMQVNNTAGLTFEVGLRALLRQDPDHHGR